MFFNKAIKSIENKKKRVMTLGDNVSQEQMSELIRVIKQSQTLKDFVFNPVTVKDPEQVAVLFDTLKQHKSLKRLKISLKPPLTGNSLQALIGLIANHPYLNELSIENSTLTDETLPKLLPSLVSNKRLARFICDIEGLSDDIIMQVANHLIAHSGITALYFFPKNVTNHQMSNIVQSLESNQSLTEFYLSAQGYEHQALKQLFKYLRKNTTSLKVLSLNYIDEVSSLKELVNTMKQNNTLKSLSIKISPDIESITLAHELIKHNHVLQRFDFYGPDHDFHDTPTWEKLANKIGQKVKKNRELLDSQKTVEHSEKTTSNKRPTSVLQPQTSTTSLPSKRIRIVKKQETDSKENNNHLPPPIAT